MKSRSIAFLSIGWVLTTGCAESPISLTDASAFGPSASRVLATSSVQTLTGTSSYSSGKNHVAFVTTLGSKWDDIKITHGRTVITEDFNTDAWDPANFELSDPSRPGSAVGGAYQSTGFEIEGNYTARGALRTVAEFPPSRRTPLIIEATLIPPNPMREELSFLAWRSTGISLGEPHESVYLRIHNYIEGMTNLRNVDGDPTGYFGDDFYRTGPVRIKVVDDGSVVTVTFTPNFSGGPTYESTGFLAPVSMTTANTVTAGSTVPLKFQVTLDGSIVSDRAAIRNIEVTPCGALSSLNATNLGVTTNDLQFQFGTRQFVVPWRTPKAPGCYLSTVSLAGGASFSATFHVRR